MIVGTQVLVFLSAFWLVAPIVVRACDVRLVRRRLHVGTSVVTASFGPVEPSAKIRTGRTRRSRVIPLEDHLDSLARALRAGTPPRDAVNGFMLHARPGNGPVLDDSLDLESALAASARTAPEHVRDVLHLVTAACVGGGVSADGIDHAATVVRMHTRSIDEARTAAAQARLSVRVLTLLPLGALALIIISRGTGPVIASPLAVSSSLLGLVLNRIGAHWARTLSSRAATGAPDPTSPLVSSLAVSLRAGLDPVSACIRWRGINTVGTRVADLLDMHQPLRQALQPLAALSSRGSHVVATIVDSVATGLPLSAVASHILDRVHDENRRAVDLRVRQLPVRLTAPVVLCTLPSFVMLAVVPMVVAAFPHGVPGRIA